MRGFYWVVILVATASLAKFLTPLNAMDTGWDFGHAYSLLRGGNGSFYNDYLHSSPDYLYGYLIAPLAAISKSAFVPKIFYSITLSLLAFALLIRKKVLGLSIGLIILILSNYIILTHRPEIVTILLGLLAYPFVLKNHSVRWQLAVPIGIVLFFIHPANAILMSAAVLASKNLLAQRTTFHIVIYSCAICLLMYVLILAPEQHHLAILRTRILDGNPLLDFGKFLKYSGLTLAALAIAKRSIWTAQFCLNYAVLFALCLILGPYYYYVFLIVPFILEAPTSKTKTTKIAVATAILFNVYTNIIHVNLVHLENPSYAQKAFEIDEYLSNVSTIESPNNIFIDQHIGLPLYAKTANAKMIMSMANRTYFLATKPKDDDIAYFTKRKDALLFENEINLDDSGYQTEITQLLSPNLGRLTLQSLYKNRTDSLGLYKMTISQIEK